MQDKLRYDKGFTDKEVRLIEEIRKLPFGETHLIIFNVENEPIRIEIEKTKESKKL